METLSTLPFACQNSIAPRFSTYPNAHRKKYTKEEYQKVEFRKKEDIHAVVLLSLHMDLKMSFVKFCFLLLGSTRQTSSSPSSCIVVYRPQQYNEVPKIRNFSFFSFLLLEKGNKIGK